MFRKMRRFKQQLTDEECAKILQEEKRGILSVHGEDGYPYGLPLSHYYNPENGKIYFHCAKVGHKIDALRADDRVSFTVMDQGYTEGDDWALNIKSVIAFGRIRFMDDPVEVRNFLIGLSSKFTKDGVAYADKELAAVGKQVQCLEMTIDHMTGKLVNES